LRRLIVALGKFLRSMSIAENAKSLKEKCMRLLASFMVTYDIKEYTIGVSLSPEESLATGIIDDDLTDILTTLGKLAKENRETICIFIDEVQFLQTEQIRAIVAAIHRCNQLRLPISIWCAGLPKAVEVINKSCSYAERMFDYIPIGRLSAEESCAAISEPAKALGVTLDPQRECSQT